MSDSNCSNCADYDSPMKLRDFCDIASNPVNKGEAMRFNGLIYVSLEDGNSSNPVDAATEGTWYGGLCDDEYILYMDTYIAETKLLSNGDLVLTNNRGEVIPDPLNLPLIEKFVTKANGDIVAVLMNGSELPIHADLYVKSYVDRAEGDNTATYAIMSDGSEKLVHLHSADIYVVSGARNADNSLAVTMSDGSVITFPPAVTNNVVSAARSGDNLVITMKDGTVYNVPFTVDTDTTIDISDLAISGNTITITESNGDTHTVDLPAAAAPVDVTDFALSGNDLTITESNGDTHSVTLPASASDVHVTGQTFDGGTGAFVTTLSDGTTITTNFGTGGADLNTYITGVTATNQYADANTIRHFARNDKPTIDHNEEYLLPKYIDPVIVGDKNTVTANYASDVWEAYSVHSWTNADLIGLGMRTSDTAVILQLACSSLASDDEQAQVYTGFVVHGKWVRKLKVNTMKLGTDHSGDTDQIVLNDAYVLDAAGGITVDFTSFVRDMESGGAQSTWRLDIVGFQRIVT